MCLSKIGSCHNNSHFENDYVLEGGYWISWNYIIAKLYYFLCFMFVVLGFCTLGTWFMKFTQWYYFNANIVIGELFVYIIFHQVHW